jgi:hypothetical protein
VDALLIKDTSSKEELRLTVPPTCDETVGAMLMPPPEFFVTIL